MFPKKPHQSSGLHTEPSIPHTQRQVRAEHDARLMDWKAWLAHIPGTADQELLWPDEGIEHA